MVIVHHDDVHINMFSNNFHHIHSHRVYKKWKRHHYMSSRYACFHQEDDNWIVIGRTRNYFPKLCTCSLVIPLKFSSCRAFMIILRLAMIFHFEYESDLKLSSVVMFELKCYLICTVFVIRMKSLSSFNSIFSFLFYIVVLKNVNICSRNLFSFVVRYFVHCVSLYINTWKIVICKY